MNKNTIIFLVGSIGMILGWNWVMSKYYPPTIHPATSQVEQAGAKSGGTVEAKNSAPGTSANSAQAATSSQGRQASLKPAPEQLVSVSTMAYEASLSTWGARFNHLKLRGIASHVKDKVEDLDLVANLDEPRYATVQLPGVDLAGMNWTLLTKEAVMENGKPTVRFAARVPNQPIELTKTFQFDPAKPQFDLRISIKNSGTQPLNLAPLSLQWGPNLGGDTAGIGQFPPAGAVHLDVKVEREKANNEQSVNSYANPKWVALKNHYFVAGYFPMSPAWNKAELRRQGAGKIETALVADGLVLAPGKAVDLDVLVYAGAQDYDVLKAFGHNFKAVVQFQFYSWFEVLNPLCVMLLQIMKWFHKVTGNWGFAIILLTLLVRGVMFYPSLKSMVSMRRMQTKMAAMQPRLDTLKKVYKDDAQKLNSEMMKLYKEYGVNPLGGCLPMLLQIPIFFALYGTLSAAFELRGAAFIWKWTDLTAGDPTYIFPLAMGISMFLQQKLAPVNSSTMSEEQAQMQKMMLWMMPIMFTGMSIYLHWPMGLLLYWTASNSFGVIQQLAVNKSVK
jgi:YidC/Oxa1 family membrane protein insertase